MNSETKEQISVFKYFEVGLLIPTLTMCLFSTPFTFLLLSYMGLFEELNCLVCLR